MTTMIEPRAPEKAATRWAWVEPGGKMWGPFPTKDAAHDVVGSRVLLGKAVPIEPGSPMEKALDERAEEDRRAAEEQRRQRETELRTARELAEQAAGEAAAQQKAEAEAEEERNRQTALEERAAGLFAQLRDRLKFVWSAGHGEALTDVNARAAAARSEAFEAARQGWLQGEAYLALAGLRGMKDALGAAADRTREAADAAEAAYQAALAGDDPKAVAESLAPRTSARKAANAAASAYDEFVKRRVTPATEAAREDWRARHVEAVEALRRDAEARLRRLVEEASAALTSALPDFALAEQTRGLLARPDVPGMPD